MSLLYYFICQKLLYEYIFGFALKFVNSEPKITQKKYNVSTNNQISMLKNEKKLTKMRVNKKVKLKVDLMQKNIDKSSYYVY